MENIQEILPNESLIVCIIYNKLNNSILLINTENDKKINEMEYDDETFINNNNELNEDISYWFPYSNSTPANAPNTILKIINISLNIDLNDIRYDNKCDLFSIYRIQSTYLLPVNLEQKKVLTFILCQCSKDSPLLFNDNKNIGWFNLEEMRKLQNEQKLLGIEPIMFLLKQEKLEYFKKILMNYIMNHRCFIFIMKKKKMMIKIIIIIHQLNN